MDVKSSAENLIVKEGIGGREMNFISFLLFFFFSLRIPLFGEVFFFQLLTWFLFIFYFFQSDKKKIFLEKKKTS